MKKFFLMACFMFQALVGLSAYDLGVGYIHSFKAVRDVVLADNTLNFEKTSFDTNGAYIEFQTVNNNNSMFLISGARLNADFLITPNCFLDHSLYTETTNSFSFWFVEEYNRVVVEPEVYLGVGVGNENMGCFLAGCLGVDIMYGNIKGKLMTVYSDYDYETNYASSVVTAIGLPVGLKVGGFVGTEKLKLQVNYKISVDALQCGKITTAINNDVRSERTLYALVNPRNILSVGILFTKD